MGDLALRTGAAGIQIRVMLPAIRAVPVRSGMLALAGAHIPEARGDIPVLSADGQKRSPAGRTSSAFLKTESRTGP